MDFPTVFRAMAPIDSIVQAAGRSNREGKLDKGKVFIFELIGGGCLAECTVKERSKREFY